MKNYSFESIEKVDAVIVVSPHKVFSELSIAQLKEKITNPPVLVDLKGLFNGKEARKKGFLYEEL